MKPKSGFIFLKSNVMLQRNYMSDNVNKRPVLVWIIFILTIIGFIQFCFVFGINNGFIQINKEYTQGLSEFTLFKNIKMIVMQFIFLFAAIMLFRLKAIAFKLYLLYAILAMINLIYSFIFPNPPIENSLIDTKDMMFYGALVSMGITLLLVYYAYSLSKKDILKT